MACNSYKSLGKIKDMIPSSWRDREIKPRPLYIENLPRNKKLSLIAQGKKFNKEFSKKT